MSNPFDIVSVVLDKPTLARLQVELNTMRGQAKRLIVSSLNDAARKARNEIVRVVSGAVLIKQADVKRTIVVHAATANNPVATVVVRSKRKDFPLAYFAGAQTRRGVGYRISRTGGRQMLLHGFKKTAKGTPGVFIRATQNGLISKSDAIAASIIKKPKLRGKKRQPSGLVGRYPIMRAAGVSPVGVLQGERSRIEAILAAANEHLNQRVNSKLDFLLSDQGQGSKLADSVRGEYEHD